MSRSFALLSGLTDRRVGKIFLCSEEFSHIPSRNQRGNQLISQHA